MGGAKPLEIRLVCHASVMIDTDLGLWTDPWLHGRAFNESWRLYPQPLFDEAWLRSVDFLWISHEHPDHFNIPTLRALPASFKERVEVLFQKNNSTKMIDAFRKLGFPRFRTLPHRERVSLSSETDVYCYQVGQMDSCLAVMSHGQTVLNVNDAQISARDCRRLRRDIGAPDVVLNQFSIAGYGGFEDYKNHLPRMAARHLDGMLENHRILHAGVTIPFASFIHFCTEDNAHMNEYANSPRDVHEHFAAAGESSAILFPGDTYEVGSIPDSDHALERFDTLPAPTEDATGPTQESVPLDELSQALQCLSSNLQKYYPHTLLRCLKPVTASIPDLGCAVRFSMTTGALDRIHSPHTTDLVIHSQPLAFVFRNPFGLQTLGVSARYTLRGGFRNWKLHRALMGLYNAELYLKPRYLLQSANLRYLYSRRRDIVDQLANRFSMIQKGF